MIFKDLKYEVTPRQGHSLELVRLLQFTRRTIFVGVPPECQTEMLTTTD